MSTSSTRSSRSGVSVSEIRLAIRWPGPHVARLPDEAADLGHRADQHPARPGHGVVHLAPLGHDPLDLAGDPRRVAAGRLAQLAKGGRVEVQALDVEPASRRPRCAGRCPAAARAAGTRPGRRAHGAGRSGRRGSAACGSRPASSRPYRRRERGNWTSAQDVRDDRCAHAQWRRHHRRGAGRDHRAGQGDAAGRPRRPRPGRCAACSGWRCWTTSPTTWRRATCC